MVRRKSSKGNLGVQTPSFHHSGPSDCTQVVRHGGGHLCMLSHLANSLLTIF